MYPILKALLNYYIPFRYERQGIEEIPTSISRVLTSLIQSLCLDVLASTIACLHKKTQCNIS